MAEPAIEKAFLAESIEEALNEEREKYAQEEENRVVRLIKRANLSTIFWIFLLFSLNVYSNFLLKLKNNF